MVVVGAKDRCYIGNMYYCLCLYVCRSLWKKRLINNTINQNAFKMFTIFVMVENKRFNHKNINH